MSRPYGTTIFCDDIRDEASGKKTYVGVYFGEMLITSPLPAVVPLFALAITYLEPLADPVQLVNLKVFVPGPTEEGELAADVELPVDRADTIEDRNRDPLAQYRAHIMHFKISPFVIAHEGYVKVRAYIGDEEVKLGSLRVRLADEDEKTALGIEV
jgi:hypothetical protein